MLGAARMSPTGQTCYSIEQISGNVHCIKEADQWDRQPYMYLIVGDEKGSIFSR